MRIPQDQYAELALYMRREFAKAASPGSKLDGLCKEARKIPQKEWSLDHPLVKMAGRAIMKAQHEILQKAGITTSLGFNFYDLRGPAYMIFPINTPFIQMIGKQGKVNAGVGTVANWKATRNPNSTNIYVGVQEGQRNATATPNEVNYFATYKELGMEGGETFTAQWAGEGYTDNLADEQFRNLARLRLGEEMMTLWGNSGTASGNLGYALGQAPTPTVTLASGTSTIGSTVNILCAVAAITPFGMNPGGQAGYAAPPSVANGLTTSYVRTNADGSTTNVACGIGQLSNIGGLSSNTNSTYQTATVSIAAQKGAVGYAWFFNSNVTAATGNLKLGAITAWPSLTINAAPGGNYLANAAGLSTDNSYQPTDFDGLGTYAFNNGLWTDMNGGSFTPAGNGQVAELESDLVYLWNNYQAQPDAIWVSADVRENLEKAIIYSSTGTNSYIFQYNRDQQGNLMGGFLVTAYKSKYSINPDGGAAIPIRLHPAFPTGTLLYDINTNPYPASRVPAVRSFLIQRDYYGIMWPVVTRQWTFGTYIQEVLAHYMPWISAIRTGVGPFVAP